MKMAKKIEAKLIASIKDYENLTVNITVDFDKELIKAIRQVCLIKYLKDILEQNAQSIVYAANILAELNEKTIEHEDCYDEYSNQVKI